MHLELAIGWGPRLFLRLSDTSVQPTQTHKDKEEQLAPENQSPFFKMQEQLTEENSSVAVTNILSFYHLSGTVSYMSMVQYVRCTELALSC
ncbi:hypothetical protein Pmani_005944 [Petrolisthes manimaculis]|uniref:Uncharacterized protein n=1 Tax=Petrolisthes manimaculis TaxID=1843537 RepID=A0AAE1QBN3_9EUCA|nr:hypothetical protein Pmani_005944 [Petrolisthes manimaculis]